MHDGLAELVKEGAIDDEARGGRPVKMVCWTVVPEEKADSFALRWADLVGCLSTRCSSTPATYGRDLIARPAGEGAETYQAWMQVPRILHPGRYCQHPTREFDQQNVALTACELP